MTRSDIARQRYRDINRVRRKLGFHSYSSQSCSQRKGWYFVPTKTPRWTRYTNSPIRTISISPFGLGSLCHLHQRLRRTFKRLWVVPIDIKYLEPMGRRWIAGVDRQCDISRHYSSQRGSWETSWICRRRGSRSEESQWSPRDMHKRRILG